MASRRDGRGIGGMAQPESKNDTAVDPRTAVDEPEIGPLGANMQTINIHEARTHLFWLVDAAALGEEIVIARDGKPVARLLPVQHNRVPRRFGALKGKVNLADDFDAPLPDDLIAVFERR
jgi:prevent-host-death family protein